MNHIYKVIWNQAKHCYTVVSEIAKNHKQGAKSKKSASIATVLAVSALLGCMPFVSAASDTIHGEMESTKIGFEHNTSLKNSSLVIDSEKSQNTSSSKDSNDKTVEVSVYAETDSDPAIVFDQDKTSLKSTNAKNVYKNSIALGKEAEADTEDTIAIGNGAHASGKDIGKGTGHNGVAIGNNSYAGYKGISLGHSATSDREGAIIIGDSANSQGLYTTVIGTDSQLTIDYTPYKYNFLGQREAYVQGALSTSFGAKNTMTNDNKGVYSGIANSIVGSANKIKNSNGVTIQGTGNTVTNAYKDMDIKNSEIFKILGGNYSSLAEKDSGAIAVIGGANIISNQTSSTVIGFGNTLTGNSSTGTAGVFTAGSHNTLTNVSNSLIMGDNNTLENRTNVISLGNGNTVKADNAVAIGNGSTVTAEGGVAIGTNSVADRAVKDDAVGAFAPDTIPDANKSIWTATAGAVSVGDANKNITRQITNVAAGSEDTDAVNVAQLRNVASVANKGWNLSTDKGTATNVAPGDTVNFIGDSNITINNTDKNVSITLNKDLKDLTSVTTNKAYVTNVDESDNSVTNVKYVKDQIAGATLKEGNGISIVDKKINVKLKDGEQNLVVDKDGLSLKDDIILGDTGSDHSVAISGSKGTLIASNSISAGNVIMDGQAGDITGLTNKTLDGTDFAKTGRAATEEQLKLVSDKADTANKGWNLSTNGSKETTQVKPGETVDFSGDDNISVSNDGRNVKTTLNKDLKGIETITNGDAKINLNETGIVISKGNDKIFSITDTGMGMSVIGDDYITRSIMVGKNGTVISGGLSVAGSKITNVAAGEADTDAVNMGQLKDAISKGNTDSHIKAGEYEVGADNKVSMDIVDKNGQSTGEKVTIKDVAKASDVGDVSKIDKDIQNKDGKTTVVDAVNNVNNKVGDLNYSNVEKGEIADGDNTTTAIGKLNQKLSDVEKTAGAHSTVSTDDSGNISVVGTKDEKTGSTDYKVSLNKDLTLDSVTTGDTKMDTNGVKVGETVSLTKNGLTAGDTKVTNSGLSIGDKTYVSKDGLNANNQKVTNVSAGDISADSKDAVNGSQLFATNQQVVQNAQSINKLGGRINKVGAGAAALAALHPLDFDPDDKWDFAAGYGNYNGENAVALGAYYRPNEDTMFSVGGSFGNGENMVNAGVSLKLGQGNHVSTSKVAMAKEIKDLRKELEVLKSALLDMHAGKKMDTSKLQLFPDVPKNHWAYEYVTTLKGNGMLTGYPDGDFKGDRCMTRYEFATMLYNAMLEGATLPEQMLQEFAPELERFTVDTVHQDKQGKPTVERVRTVKADA